MIFAREHDEIVRCAACKQENVEGVELRYIDDASRRTLITLCAYCGNEAQSALSKWKHSQ